MFHCFVFCDSNLQDTFSHRLVIKNSIGMGHLFHRDTWKGCKHDCADLGEKYCFILFADMRVLLIDLSFIRLCPIALSMGSTLSSFWGLQNSFRRKHFTKESLQSIAVCKNFPKIFWDIICHLAWQSIANLNVVSVMFLVSFNWNQLYTLSI